MAELFEEQQESLLRFIKSGKLTVHPISSEARDTILRHSFPRSLSVTDQTVLYLAMELGAMVISSDKVMRNTAKRLAIEYHGMLWIMDQLIEFRLLTPKEVSRKLELLTARNVFYQHNSKLMHEVEKRLKKWRRTN